MSKLRFGRLKSLGCWKLSRKVWRTSSNISKLRLASAACCVADSYGVCRAAYAGYVYSVGTYCSLQGREDLGRAVDRLSAGPPRKTPSLWVKKERGPVRRMKGKGRKGRKGGWGARSNRQARLLVETLELSFLSWRDAVTGAQPAVLPLHRCRRTSEFIPILCFL